ncbi:MAG TPA: DUF523 and DUF1722 domain-containing protein [Myxococcota bacterium]|nr:DUF523 and DUF1722 domain-containing protein [Myxococcota bacterium]
MTSKPPHAAPLGRVRIGVSACLLGHEVRFDGGHKRDCLLIDTFSPFVEWVPVCPEVELGMGVPREPVRLEQAADGLRLVASQSTRDWTLPMRRFAARRVHALKALELSGYVLKQDSPSCGMERVRVYVHAGDRSRPRREGRGLFAHALIAANPLLPVEEEGRLWSPRVREGFVARILAYHRLRGFFAGRWSRAGLVAFHTSHRFTLRAHSPRGARRLDRLIAQAKEFSRPELRARYETEFMGTVSTPTTIRRHADVLAQIVGLFRARVDASSRAELFGLIGEYRRGQVPLTAPITRIRHQVLLHRLSDLEGQTYLEPDPEAWPLPSRV